MPAEGHLPLSIGFRMLLEAGHSDRGQNIVQRERGLLARHILARHQDIHSREHQEEYGQSGHSLWISLENRGNQSGWS